MSDSEQSDNVDRQPERLPPTPDWAGLLASIVIGLVISLLMRGAPFLGHDWRIGFSTGGFAPYYPPWLALIIAPLVALPTRIGLSILHGLTLSTVAVMSYRYARYTFPDSRATAILALAFSLLNPIPWMMLWAGQIEVVVLLGIMLLPFGAPLLLLKTNLGPWAALGSRKAILWMVAWTILSIAIWGFWPRNIFLDAVGNRMFDVEAMGWGSTHPLVGLFGVALFLFTTRDPLRLIAAGFFMSPFVMPLHHYMLLPALGRTRGYAQLGLFFLAFMPLISNGIPESIPLKFTAMLFPLMVWVLLAPSLRPREVLADPNTILNRSLHTLRAIWGKSMHLLGAHE
jgi:hypothetical protein